MPQSERLQDNQIFGRYQIVRMLGEGGMGAVYEVIHLGLKKRFAIKTLLPSIAQSTEAKARFLREGEAASRMNHPNVVDITDVGTEGGVPYLVMEYLEGETLGDFVNRKGPLDLAVAVDLLLPTISAVAAGHDQGVIHRDLKPQNIFLARGTWGEAIPKVLDFGVSKLLGGDDPALTGTMAVLGTASYMSPEQARGARVVDAKSDQYATGLIFSEMLTGQRVHQGEHPLEVLHKIASGVVSNPLASRPDLPREVEAILMRMLADLPGQRHASLRAVGLALLPFATDKARMNFSEAFAHDSGELPMAFPGSRGKANPPSPASRSGGTKLLPVASKKEITTLGQSAIETAGALRRGSLGRKVVIGGAVAAAALLGVVVLREQGTTGVLPAAPSSTASASRPTTPTSATPQLAPDPPEPIPERPHAPVAPPPEPAPRPAAATAGETSNDQDHRKPTGLAKDQGDTERPPGKRHGQLPSKKELPSGASRKLRPPATNAARVPIID